MKGRKEKWDWKGRWLQPLAGPEGQYKGVHLVLGALKSSCFGLVVFNHFNHF